METSIFVQLCINTCDFVQSFGYFIYICTHEDKTDYSTTAFHSFVLSSCWGWDCRVQTDKQNGLPDNNIRKIEQDNLGYLYMRGRYGIYKYDGYRFHVLTDEEAKHAPKSESSSGNRPGSTFKDNLGNPMILLGKRRPFVHWQTD